MGSSIMEEMRQAPLHALSLLSRLCVAQPTIESRHTHILTGKITAKFSTRVSFLYYSKWTRGPFIVNVIYPVSYFGIKKLKNEAKGARRSVWLETSKPQAFLSGLSVEPRPEGHEEAHSVLALFWHGRKHRSISRTIYKPLAFLQDVPFSIIFWPVVVFWEAMIPKTSCRSYFFNTEYFEEGILKLPNASSVQLMTLTFLLGLQYSWCLRKQGLIK